MGSVISFILIYCSTYWCMLRITTLLFALAISGTASAQAPDMPASPGKTDLQQFGLRGKVKELQQTSTLRHSFNGREATTISINIFRFNEAGNLTESINCSTSDSRPGEINGISAETGLPDTTESHTVYTYTAEGLLIRTEETGYMMQTKIVEFTYNLRGLCISSLEYSPGHDGPKLLTKMSYDKKGKLEEKTLEELQDDQPPFLRERHRYQYDKAGNLVARKYYDKEKQSWWQDYTATYTADGKPLRTTLLLPDGSPWSTTIYHYDAGGKLTYTSRLDANGRETRAFRTEMQTDRMGNWLTDTHQNDSGQSPYANTERSIQYY
jgi:hypothetical protein